MRLQTLCIGLAALSVTTSACFFNSDICDVGACTGGAAGTGTTGSSSSTGIAPGCTPTAGASKGAKGGAGLVAERQAF